MRVSLAGQPRSAANPRPLAHRKPNISGRCHTSAPHTAHNAKLPLRPALIVVDPETP